MAVTVRTIVEAEAAGLRIPDPFKGQPDDYLIGHDDDDEAVMVWGPASEREVVLANAKMYD